jgi:acyl-CoA reductase-like NAD-dependent aldehyde dehydrogenase/nicotinamidase-related amidase
MSSSHPALLLVDLQLDFLNRPGLEPHPGTLIAGAAAWLGHFRRRDAAIGHLHTVVRRSNDLRMPHWKDADVWWCEEGTPGAQSPDELLPTLGEPLFEKTGFVPDDLSRILDWIRTHGSGQVVLAGVMGHACIQFLATSLHGAGLPVALARDAIGSDRPLAASAALHWMNSRGIRLLTDDPETSLTQWPGISIPRSTDLDERSERTDFSGTISTPTGSIDWALLRPKLDAWAAHLESEASRLVQLLIDEIGKPRPLAQAEIASAVAQIRDVIRHRDRAVLLRTTDCGQSRRVPLGLTAVITPWNNPVSIPVGRVAPALAYGNPVAWKPSPRTPEISRLLLHLARQSGIDASALSLIEGGTDTGMQLIRNPPIRAVVFSGSSGRGREVLAASAERFLPCQLELGGNNASLVASDGATPEAAEQIIAGAFGFSGQRCTANRRVVVVPEIAAAFRMALIRRMEQLTPTSLDDPTCTYGPVIDETAARRIEALLARTGRTARVTRFHQNTCLGLGPRYVAPALVEDAAPESEIVQEESFGPVLVLQKSHGWDHALELINGVRQGLSAALFSHDPQLQADFQRRVQAGILKFNHSTAGPLPGLPFGGWKHSGWGGAEHAEADLEFFTRHQSILTRL